MEFHEETRTARILQPERSVSRDRLSQNMTAEYENKKSQPGKEI
jgi:hypothetical protein